MNKRLDKDLFFEFELQFNGRFVTKSFENLKPFLASFNPCQEV